MAVDITTIVLTAKSEGIDNAAKSLKTLAESSKSAENASVSLSKAGQDLSESQKTSSTSSDKLLASLQKQVDLLGANTSQVNAYSASLQGSTQLEQQIAMMLGAEVDAYKARSVAQSQAISENKALDASYKSLVDQANSYYAAQDKKQNASNDAGYAAFKAEEAKRIAEAQSELIRITKELAAVESSAQKARSADHAAALAENKALDASYRNLTTQANAYYEAQNKKQNASNEAGYSAFKVAEAKKVADAQSELIRMSRELAATEKQTALAGESFIKNLQEQAGRASLTGKALRDYNLDLQQTRANQLGVGAQATPLIQSLKDTGTAAHGAHSGMAGITREFIVMTHEMSQGQFTRLGGSAMVMMEKFDMWGLSIKAAKAASESLSLSMGVVAGAAVGVIAGLAAAGIAAATFFHSQSDLKKFNNEIILTGGYAGATGEHMYAMATSIGLATGQLGNARKAAIELTASGRFTADQIGSITKAAVELEHYAGVSIESTIKNFEKLAKEPLGNTERSFHTVTKAAMAMDQQLHFLEPSVLAQALAFENVGNSAAASDLLIKSLADTLEHRIEHTKENITEFGRVVENVLKGVTNWWNGLFTKKVGEQALADMRVQLVEMDKMSKSPMAAFGGFLTGSGVADAHQRSNLVQKIADEELVQVRKVEAAKTLAASKELDQQVNVALISRNTLREKTRGEALFNEKKEKYLAADALLRQRGLGASDEEIKKDLSKIRGQSSERTPKARAEGTSRIDSELKKIEEETRFRQDSYSNELKSLDNLYRNKNITIQEFADKKDKLLKQEVANTTTAMNTEISMIEKEKIAYKHSINEKNVLNGKIAEISRLKQTMIANENLEILLNSRIVEDAAKAEARAVQEASDKVVEGIKKQTVAVQAKIDAYNRLPATIRSVGITDKQWQDQVTQSYIDSVDAQIEKEKEQQVVNLATIQQLKDKRNALIDERDTQKIREGQEKTNNEALKATQKVKDMSNKLSDDITSAIVDGGGKGWKKLRDDMIHSFAKMILRPIIDPISNAIAGAVAPAVGGASGGGGGLFGSLFKMGASALMGGMGGFSSSFSLGNAGVAASSGLSIADLAGAFADGGDPPVGKMSLVGERGPELFVPKQAGKVIPNHLLNGASQGSTDRPTNYTIVNQTTGRIDSVKEQRLSDGDKALIITEAVNATAASLYDSNSKMSKGMRSTHDIQRKR